MWQLWIYCCHYIGCQDKLRGKASLTKCPTKQKHAPPYFASHHSFPCSYGKQIIVFHNAQSLTFLKLLRLGKAGRVCGSNIKVRLCSKIFPMYQISFIILGQLGRKFGNRKIWVRTEVYKENNAFRACNCLNSESKVTFEIDFTVSFYEKKW